MTGGLAIALLSLVVQLRILDAMRTCAVFWEVLDNILVVVRRSGDVVVRDLKQESFSSSAEKARASALGIMTTPHISHPPANNHQSPDRLN